MTEYDFDLDESKDFDVLDFGEKFENEAKLNTRYIESNLWTKLEKTGKKISYAKDIIALLRYLRDPGVSRFRKAIVATGLIYFISPINSLPKFTPLIECLDDLGVVKALLKFLGSELVPYYNPDYKAVK
jgi:uncharacterized membrane protein YkvA (DUF1232 family)